MQVVLEKEYPVAAPLDAAWLVLSDVQALASCMPGASITEKVDDRHFKGQVKVKVGPASANFGGDIELKGLDATERQIQMLGKGADKGGSSASMDLTARLVAVDDASCKLVGKAEVTVTGKFAQFGGRMMNSVSDMILGQFAQNFSNRAQLQAMQRPGPEAAGTSASSASSGTTGAQSHTDAHHAATSASDSALAPAGANPVAPSQELNALAIVWGLIKRFFAGLFGSSK
ncbi:MAG: carbon monoxide dehydrogenase [Betaproteobacteria bacterium]|nr:SRPBCC family protein [Pseudomonadota bacterium]NBO11664.1 carbon monoxide dehydrogenase [Betaproteobacteria bacterium]NBO43423.1 carbon monoxide dehydrogenase [Betaproteobacteria bacterium]NBP10124.1 carbon monoxide dehydrogenase [Betaproteobacteria bacterium]NBP61245.1 carbon monoxide dehydrogenase [Betaproteobacteria bacterium]